MKIGRRIVLEGAVIVFSILVAFAIDSWWQERQAADLEAQYLDALLLDVERTRLASEEMTGRQERTAEETRALAARVVAGGVSSDTIALYSPTIWVTSESMDTYRDLVASGGTTRIRTLEVRRVMAQVQRRVDYLHTAEAWALDLQTSLRTAIWAAPMPITQGQVDQVWAAYSEIDQTLIQGHRDLAAASDTALVVLRSELEAR